MMNRVRIRRLVGGLVLMGVFIFGSGFQLQAGEQKTKRNRTFEKIQITGKQAGYILLNSIVVTFAELSRTGKGSEEMILRELNSWMAQARLAKEKKLIDNEFFERYKRILVVIRLTIIREADHAFDHLIIREINKFDIPRKMEGKVRGLATAADALAQEILSLKRYLDQKLAFGDQGAFLKNRPLDPQKTSV